MESSVETILLIISGVLNVALMITTATPTTADDRIVGRLANLFTRLTGRSVQDP